MSFFRPPSDVMVMTRAICMGCELLYWAYHPMGARVFHCPACKLLTAVPVHA